MLPPNFILIYYIAESLGNVTSSIFPGYVMYTESTVIISVTEEHEGSALNHNKPIFTI